MCGFFSYSSRRYFKTLYRELLWYFSSCSIKEKHVNLLYALPFLLVVYWTMTGTYLSKTITHSSTFFSLFFRQYEYYLDFLMWRFFETLTLWFYNVYIVEETSLNIIFALTPLYSSVRKGGFYITFFFLSFTLKEKNNESVASPIASRYISWLSIRLNGF